jgi:hypothetical protein
MRMLTKRTRLYTEMVVDATVIHNPRERPRFLGFDDKIEHPVAIQLGGNDPTSLAQVTEIANDWGYDGTLQITTHIFVIVVPFTMIVLFSPSLPWIFQRLTSIVGVQVAESLVIASALD